MKNYKFLSSLLSAVMAIGILGGCASSGQPETTSPQNPTDKKSEAAESAGEVNIYTARHYEVDEVLYDKFTEKTGIKVNVVKGKAEELIERMKREGEKTPADLFITVDGGVLNNAKQNDLLQPVESDVLNQQVPEQFRDVDNHWIGLSTRARVIAYAKDRIKPEQLSTYEDLASDQWKGKVLVRSSSSLYNQSLVASLIELNGEQQTQEWAQGIVNNMAREPEGGDRDQAKAIVAGLGDVAIMNTYYYGLMLNSKDPEEVKVAEQVALFFPNQETTGTHLNISGAGLSKYSKNKENAIKLIEYLTAPEAQAITASENFEFPVNPEAEKPEVIKSWGEFKAQDLDFAKLGDHNKTATEIMNKVGWK